MGRTKKVGPTGRFGPRYGSRVRKRVKEIEVKMKSAYKCPSCETRAVRRISAGVWECKKCGAKMTGGAWEPVTAPGKVSKRTILSKSRELAGQTK
ncbi:MAG: 50S ribosomal protein L37Ae [Promethearchaeota archaeon]